MGAREPASLAYSLADKTSLTSTLTHKHANHTIHLGEPLHFEFSFPKVRPPKLEVYELWRLSISPKGTL